MSKISGDFNESYLFLIFLGPAMPSVSDCNEVERSNKDDDNVDDFSNYQADYDSKTTTEDYDYTDTTAREREETTR